MCVRRFTMFHRAIQKNLIYQSIFEICKLTMINENCFRFVFKFFDLNLIDQCFVRKKISNQHKNDTKFISRFFARQVYYKIVKFKWKWVKFNDKLLTWFSNLKRYSNLSVVCSWIVWHAFLKAHETSNHNRVDQSQLSNLDQSLGPVPSPEVFVEQRCWCIDENASMRYGN